MSLCIRVAICQEFHRQAVKSGITQAAYNRIDKLCYERHYTYITVITGEMPYYIVLCYNVYYTLYKLNQVYRNKINEMDLFLQAFNCHK